MATQQTKLQDQTVAQELAENQKSISVAEFFETNKHMLGFDSKSRAIVTAVKEAVDNALDASEEAEILPEINVSIEDTGEYYRVIVEDNGPGITESQLSKIYGQLLYGSRFHQRLQTRGQQGLGISAAVLYAQQTSGLPAIVRSKTHKDNQAVEMSVKVDTESNSATIENERKIDWPEKDHGTRVELTMDANMRARKQLHQYIEDTALVNPHARITLEEPEWSFESERATEDLPPKPEEIKPHPHGIELGTLTQMLQETTEDSLLDFLQNDFTRVGKKTAESILDLAEEYYRDNFSGRALGWDVDTALESYNRVEPSEDNEKPEPTNVTLQELVYDSINRKSEEAKTTISESLAETFTNRERVTYPLISKETEAVCDLIESDLDERVGPAVRDSIKEDIWSFLVNNREDELSSRLLSVTSQRKTEESITVFANNLLDVFETVSTNDQFTEDSLENCIEKASDQTENQIGTSFGQTSRQKIFDELWEKAEQSSDEIPEINSILSDESAIKSLNMGMKNAKVMAPPSKCLSPITPDLMDAGLQEMFPEADMYSTSQRDGSVRKGSPFVVEAGIAYGEDIQNNDEQIDLRRFANRVPLVYQQGACATTKVTKNIDWRNYNLKQTGGEGSMPRGPMVLMVHVGSTNVPFTSESKDAIVPDDDVLEKEIELAIREVARDLKDFTKEQKRLQKLEAKREQVGDILPPLVDSFAAITKEDSPDSSESMARIMNNLLIRYDEDESQVELKSYLTKSISGTLVVDGEEHSFELGSEASQTFDVEDPSTLSVQNVDSKRVNVTRNLNRSAEDVTA